jgi:CRP/FNR family transcriptional regulator
MKDELMNQDSLFVADPRLVQALEQRAHPIPCRDSCVLFSQGEAPRGLHILLSGEVALVMKSSLGAAVMCLRAQSGSLLGLPAVAANEPYTLTAIARKGSEVKLLTRNDYEDIMRAQPSLALMVLQVLAHEVRAARQALSEV